MRVMAVALWADRVRYPPNPGWGRKACRFLLLPCVCAVICQSQGMASLTRAVPDRNPTLHTARILQDCLASRNRDRTVHTREGPPRGATEGLPRGHRPWGQPTVTRSNETRSRVTWSSDRRGGQGTALIPSARPRRSSPARSTPGSPRRARRVTPCHQLHSLHPLLQPIIVHPSTVGSQAAHHSRSL